MSTSGVTPHFRASQNSLYLHLLADTGNKWKKLRVREEYLPVPDIRARIRVPQGRKVKAVTLVRGATSVKFETRADWVHVTVPRVFIHEAIRVDLA